MNLLQYLNKILSLNIYITFYAILTLIFLILIISVFAFLRAMRGRKGETVKVEEVKIEKVKESENEKTREVKAAIKEEFANDTIIAEKELEIAGLKKEVEKLKLDLIKAIEAQKAAPVAESGGDEALKKKLSETEASLDEAAKALEELQKAYDDQVKEIETLKATPAAAPAAGADPKELGALKEKIEFLESQLAEYEVIEEDIANLKKLQEEKQQLLAKLETYEKGNVGVKAPKGQPIPEPVNDNTLETTAETKAPAADGIADQFEQFVNETSST